MIFEKIKEINGVKFSINLIPKINSNRPGKKIVPKIITIHETANTSTGAGAKAHASYIKNPKTKVSWHFTVDDKEIIQHLPINELAYHSGSLNGNKTSIGVELCVNKDGDFNKTKENLYKLLYLLEKEINLKVLRPHSYWFKNTVCPKNINKYGWNKFINDYENFKKELDSKDKNIKIKELEKEIKDLKELLSKINKISKI